MRYIIEDNHGPLLAPSSEVGLGQCSEADLWQFTDLAEAKAAAQRHAAGRYTKRQRLSHGSIEYNLMHKGLGEPVRVVTYDPSVANYRGREVARYYR